MGDSAGGNYALSLMNVLSKLDVELPSKLIAIYPPVDLRQTRFTPSLLHSFNDKLLYFSVGRSCVNSYTPAAADAERDWILSPGLAPDSILKKYPQTTLITGELDSLRDDIVKLGYRIHRLGMASSKVVQVKGIYHGFMGFELPGWIGIKEVGQLHKLVEGYIVEDSLQARPLSTSTKDKDTDDSSFDDSSQLNSSSDHWQ